VKILVATGILGVFFLLHALPARAESPAQIMSVVGQQAIQQNIQQATERARSLLHSNPQLDQCHQRCEKTSARFGSATAR
jgi:hypothetical protein